MPKTAPQKCINCAKLTAEQSKRLHGPSGTSEPCWDSKLCPNRRSHLRHRNSVAAEFLDINFVVVQGGVTGTNLSSYEVLQEQSAWLAGAAAGLLTQTGVVGHTSGIRVSPGLKGRAAFADGLRYTNATAQFLTNFCGTQDDADRARQLALAEIEAGADLIFTMLNAGRTGVTDICRERGVSQIGTVRSTQRYR